MAESDRRRALLAGLFDARHEDLLWFRAPGRVNLIGEHTDYNEGFVLPVAVDLDCLVAAKPNKGKVRVRSLDAPGTVDIAADGSDEPRTVVPEWGRYVAGIVRALAELGRAGPIGPVGIDAGIGSTVPLGAGLSSSAALEVATALALMEVAGMQLPETELAEACRHAEHIATGVPCGIMDQLVSVAGVEGAALLIDCRSLETEVVQLPAGVSIIAIDSGVRRELADSAYYERRASCETAAADLGLPSLRDADWDDVQHDPFARHVVSENQRVLETVEALRRNDHEELGRLFAESHSSLRDDFEVSTPELDLLVELLVDSGAIAARLTGAGFGGSVVALVERRARAVIEDAIDRYRVQSGRRATGHLLRASDGAGPVSFGS